MKQLLVSRYLDQESFEKIIQTPLNLCQLIDPIIEPHTHCFITKISIVFYLLYCIRNWRWTNFGQDYVCGMLEDVSLRSDVDELTNCLSPFLIDSGVIQDEEEGRILCESISNKFQQNVSWSKSMWLTFSESWKCNQETSRTNQHPKDRRKWTWLEQHLWCQRKGQPSRQVSRTAFIKFY